MISLDLSGKRALVTGDTRGLGYAMAVRLAQAGAVVGVSGRSQASVATAVTGLRGEVADGTFVGVVPDVGTDDGAQSALDQFPGVDILVNNIGIYQSGNVLSTPENVWAEHYDANVLTGVRLTRRALPGMLGRKWGRCCLSPVMPR
ncbi:SDR family NAD(P)-dependent oxidoreductase [Microbacterium sp. SSM24]|uniref:SDR family NAD(P)-dependent oxidoreductase n=1 Tax=Microbacterium sp. SSM24 TaxID=2991714 RepID=UPI00222681D9|nr:SDR family oxidoreductase [Microbacterium sp. SSM24]MCW3492717.1 SDR family oxidoreductase [Microbacterium sp. SSM24]